MGKSSVRLGIQCAFLSCALFAFADEDILIKGFNPCLNTLSSKLSVIDSKVDVVESSVEALEDFCASIPVFGPGPVTISTPGSYCLAQDVTTITISASQVTLNLNGHTVSSATAGITVSGISPANIIIRNGIVQASIINTGTGISLLSGGNNIVLEKVNILNWQTGINASNIEDTIVQHCIIANCDTVGIQLANITNTQIQQCLITGNSKGLLLADTSSTSKGLKVLECAFQQNQTANNAVDIQSGDCFEFASCSALGNATAFNGFSIANASNVIVNECNACGFSDNSAGQGNGFKISGVDTVSIINCVSKDNVTGFLATNSTQGIIRGSIATGNTTGFSWDGSGGTQFYSNMACDNATVNFTPNITSAPVTSPANALGADNIDCSNSDVDQIDAIESKADACCALTQSKLDIVVNFVENFDISIIEGLGSVVENITSILDITASKLAIAASISEIIAGDLSSFQDTLNLIVISSTAASSKISVVESKTDACCKLTQSKLDNITSLDLIIESKLDAGSSTTSSFDAISSQISALDSKADACCSLENSKLDNIISRDAAMDSKTDACCLQENSKLDSISSKETVIESKTDACCIQTQSKLDVIISTIDIFAGMDCSFTDTFDCSFVDPFQIIESSINAVDSKTDHCCTIINSRLSVLESLLDLLVTRTF